MSRKNRGCVYHLYVVHMRKRGVDLPSVLVVVCCVTGIVARIAHGAAHGSARHLRGLLLILLRLLLLRQRLRLHIRLGHLQRLAVVIQPLALCLVLVVRVAVRIVIVNGVVRRLASVSHC
ncbi:hypothetical protein DL89DRAFT_90144 [Linderina pennispora]|uniref:Uncharacterized protein n=1 Tax=Linderina pennispora TaxID=61395 RepID=A0A1Y1WI70_9FUNG|nr:uncharacterized protein DL89DRAFT_90144 [Linderina pennispora]ORX73229.1 hypothetical protein DL89DRAFT_90144 [Linderina pennispora]